MFGNRVWASQETVNRIDPFKTETEFQGNIEKIEYAKVKESEIEQKAVWKSNRKIYSTYKS